jgi:hypothetical protein
MSLTRTVSPALTGLPLLVSAPAAPGTVVIFTSQESVGAAGIRSIHRIREIEIGRREGARTILEDRKCIIRACRSVVDRAGVIVKVCAPEVSVPPLAVPPLSWSCTVTLALPLALPASV